MKGVMQLARKVRLICVILIVLYIVGRMPFPLLVIPLVGATVIHICNEVEEIRNEKSNKRNKKKSIKKQTKKS